MNTRCVVPEWLHDLLLGYEDPASAHYSQLKGSGGVTYQRRQDWRDTFLNHQHVRDSFPRYNVQLVDQRRKYDKLNLDSSDKSKKTQQDPPPPYRLIFPDPASDTALTSSTISGTIPVNPPLLTVEAYSPPFRPQQLVSALGGPRKGNAVRFTPTQVEAIRAGMQPGMTMVVGPPGTGKTDVAVQIIHNIYHNYPNQRTLIVTHSNQALNQLFEKIMALDINERHLLRLGHGEEGLATEKDFSRYGRVNYVLAQRLHLLADVDRLAVSLGETVGVTEDLREQQKQLEVTAEGDAKETREKKKNKSDTGFASGDENMPTYTSETAQHFFLHVVLARWEAFLARMTEATSTEASATEYDCHLFRDHFPFMEFFLGAGKLNEEKKAELFPGNSLDEDLAIARSCFMHLENLFSQLDEFRAFELMRTGVERSNYLLVQEAKIIAMTCTHAALRRRDLVDLGFTYDNILMEEAAQILEIETFIPLLLQNPDLSNLNRLKRWVMIGDHHQLPPVVKNMAFQNLCNMGQSLFARLVKLGVPVVQLDAQGRARPSLARLYSWRYDRLDDLPHVANQPEFIRPNPGFAFEYQLIDVQDFEGVGESEPSPYFYQNLAEAEYLVNVYMYMRLIGYPAERISILTTYNGQKHLIRDVITNRCADNPLIGQPSKVTTVDRFQGQQNDYILLSLVRTRTVGHVRDVRRLVVAMSRARLGLYVFARTALFSACHELRSTFNLLCSRPTHLHLKPWEAWGVNQQQLRRPAKVVQDMPDMANFVFEFYNHRLGQMMAEHRRLDKWRGSQRPPSALPQPPRGQTTSVEMEVQTETVPPGSKRTRTENIIDSVEQSTVPAKKKATEESTLSDEINSIETSKLEVTTDAVPISETKKITD